MNYGSVTYINYYVIYECFNPPRKTFKDKHNVAEFIIRFNE